MDKTTLRANALAKMRACIAHEWSSFLLSAQQQKEQGTARQMYREAVELTRIELDADLRECYNFLKEYYENG